jgi:hypothetical protein
MTSVEYLLKKKAPICWESDAGESTIQAALSGRQLEILELLLEHQASNEACPAKRTRARSGVAILRHACAEMEVLGQFEPDISFADEVSCMQEIKCASLWDHLCAALFTMTSCRWSRE